MTSRKVVIWRKEIFINWQRINLIYRGKEILKLNLYLVSSEIQCSRCSATAGRRDDEHFRQISADGTDLYRGLWAICAGHHAVCAASSGDGARGNHALPHDL